MKKILLFMISFFVLTACQTKEEKAEKLAKKALNGIIVNIDTYEPIETTVDSAYAPLMTAEVFNQYPQLLSQIRELSLAQDKADVAKMKMSIYENPYSSYGKQQYESAKEEYEMYSRINSELGEKIQAFSQKIEQYAKEEPVFNGYRVIHKCRYVDKEGNKTIGSFLFLMNEDLTEVESILDLQDEVMQSLFNAYGMMGTEE
ncbi:MAG: hypothetical protein IJ588_06470 [Prevotella sp.]|nr:hypothetical protein [Prevotella sp.]